MVSLKRCKTCGVEKPLDEFPKQRRHPDGRRPHCRVCYRNIAAKWARPKAGYTVPLEKCCVRCGNTKPASEFCSNARHRDQLSTYCRVCTRSLAVTVDPEQARAWRYEREFGLTIADYDRMLARQGGQCAICGRRDAGNTPKGRFCIDHDHVTGQVRALLCEKCNRGLGHYDDDPERLEAAARYLRAFKRG
jgi:hypothetical protein